MTMQRFDVLLQRALKTGCRLTGWPIGHAYMPSGGLLVPTNAWSLPESAWAEVFRRAVIRAPLTTKQGITGRAYCTGHVQQSTDATADTDWPLTGLRTRPRIRGAVAIPVSSRGRIAFVLQFCSTNVERLPPEDLAVLVRIAGRLGRQLGFTPEGTFFPALGTRARNFSALLLGHWPG